jgi:uncharacterized protein DUF4339
MTHDESAHEDSEDRFYAQFDSREVELMTLDELAAAFEAGQIHGNTFVCREGDSEWLTLAEVAGLGEEDEAEPEPAPVVERRPPMPGRRPEMPVAAETRPPMPERRPEMPQRRPQMETQPAARFQQSVPPAAPSVAAPSHSFAPVTSNVDYSNLDLDELAMRPKRRWGLVLAAAAVLALAGGGTVFALNGGGSALASAVPDKAALEKAAGHSQAALAPINLQPKASEPEPAAPVAPSTPEPAAAAPAAEAPKTGQLSEDMKQALLASDKSRETKKTKKAKGRATTASAAPRRSGKVAGGSAGGFKSGGSAYDPLNGKL